MNRNPYRTTDRPDVGETNGLVDGLAYHAERHEQETIETVPWTEEGLKITRFRILSDPGFPAWDISYCHGVLDGQHVDVELPFSQMPKFGKGGWKAFVVAEAKRDGVFAKGLGILDAASTLN